MSEKHNIEFINTESKKWAIYREARSKLWTEDKVISYIYQDIKDIKRLDNNELEVFYYVLSMFVIMEEKVFDNISINLMDLFTSITDHTFLAYHQYIESIHRTTYLHFVKAFIDDISKLDNCCNSDNIQKKSQWANKYIKNGTKEEVVMAFVHIEGVQFFCGFDFVCYLRNKNLFKTFTMANEYILIDETYHKEYFIELAKGLYLNKNKCYEILREGDNIEMCFFDILKKYNLTGFKYLDICEQIKKRTNRITMEIFKEKLYPDLNDEFKFDLNQKTQVRITNFFTSQSTAYDDNGVHDEINYSYM